MPSVKIQSSTYDSLRGDAAGWFLDRLRVGPLGAVSLPDGSGSIGDCDTLLSELPDIPESLTDESAAVD